MVHQPGEHVGELGPRLDALSLQVFTSEATAPCWPPASEPAHSAFLRFQGQRTDRPLDDIGLKFDTPAVEEAGGPFPTAERVADRLGELALLANDLELGAEPRSSASITDRLRPWRTERRSSAGRPRMSCSTA